MSKSPVEVTLIPLGATLWLSIWLLLNLSVTLYNKAVMNLLHFSFPWLLTSIHMAFALAGSQIGASFGVFKPSRLSSKETWRMFGFSVLYTLNLAFHQTVRSTTPFITMVIMSLFYSKTYSLPLYLSMIPVIFGVCLATLGDYDFTMLGFLLTILGTFFASLKGILTNRLQSGSNHYHPMDLLLYLSSFSLFQTIFLSVATGEFSKAAQFMETNGSVTLYLALGFNGFLAFFLNVASFIANRKTSAVSMSVAGNVKQVVTIFVSASIFDVTIGALNACGIFLTLLGGFIYSHLSLRKSIPAKDGTDYTKMDQVDSRPYPPTNSLLPKTIQDTF